MKTLYTKLFAVICIFTLATGCASVTDAGLAEQDNQPGLEQQLPSPDPAPLGGTDVQPIVVKPE